MEPLNYPYIEPCPGCFENFLLSLRNMPGNPIFFANGDFTVYRFARAFSKILPGCKLYLSVYLLEELTLCRLKQLCDDGLASYIHIFCKKMTEECETLDIPLKIKITLADTQAFFIQAESKETRLTVLGFLQQVYPSRSLEMFTFVNDEKQQKLILSAMRRFS